MGWHREERELHLGRVRATLERHLRPAIFGATEPLRVSARQLPGEPVSAADAQAGDFTPFEVGMPWGPPWGTMWFRLQGDVPREWRGREVVARVALGYHGQVGFGAEGLVYVGLEPRQGLSPNHDVVRIAASAAGGEVVDLYVEAAANPPATGGLLLPEPAGAPISRLERAELAVRRREVAAAVLDVELLLGLVQQLPADDPRGIEVLRALMRCCAALDPDDVAGTVQQARAQLVQVLSSPAGASAHVVSATGHAHIDTAWLWPLRETVRKCARSFSTALTLMDEYPDYRFACSQAAQHAWMKQHHPALFERMREKIAAGQFEPVGSMWVEADCNIPSGESLVRQLVLGKRFFLDEYGIETREVWLPDVFGYPASLPQLMAQAGVDHFLTQKISWSQTNRFPHHTFWWEGIDGTRVFSHFPPADTYNGDMSPRELLHSVRNFRDHGAAHRSLYPYGHGDGGGGPTREMIELARRSANLEGLPRVELDTVAAFFTKATADATDIATWVGELYLEYHRGTYTSQARAKRGNRRAELALREAECWAALAGGEYPRAAIDDAWRTLLLHQFHDILPGSSIHWVYQDTERAHAQVIETASGIACAARAAIAGTVDASGCADPVVVFNSLSWPRDEVVDLGGGVLAEVRVPSMGYAVADRPAAAALHGGAAAGESWLENDHLRVEWDGAGLLTSAYDKDARREVLAAGAHGNLLQLHDDEPNEYDAWDIDRFYLDRVTDVTALDEISVVSTGPARAAVRMVRRFGGSEVEQTISLDAGSRALRFATTVEWHERHKLLKVAFPVAVHSPRASFEIQYGHVERPTHANTSWDWARFEVSAHKWVDLSEPDYGVALLNDCKYGVDVRGSTLRLSLLRAPTMPDPEADQGHHEFTYALFPHQGDLRAGGVIRAAYELNVPLTVAPIGTPSRGERPGADAFIEVDRPGMIVEAVKRADGDDATIVRLYEAWGTRGPATMRFGFAVARAWRTDLLEREQDELSVSDDGVTLQLRPFEIVTLKLRA
jgi:alpha-mannosidase